MTELKTLSKSDVSKILQKAGYKFEEDDAEKPACPDGEKMVFGKCMPDKKEQAPDGSNAGQATPGAVIKPDNLTGAAGSPPVQTPDNTVPTPSGNSVFAATNSTGKLEVTKESHSSSNHKECGCTKDKMTNETTSTEKKTESVGTIAAPATTAPLPTIDFTPVTQSLDSFKNENQKTLDRLAEILGILAKPVDKKTEAEHSSKVDDTIARKKVEEFNAMKEWFIQTAQRKNTMPAHNWIVNKDEVMQKYFGVGYDGVLPTVREPSFRKIEAVTVTSGDMPQFFSNQIHRIPGGRIPLNVRPYVNFVSLAEQDRANWYKIDGMAAATITEGTEPSQASQTVTKITANPAIRGVYQRIGYSQIENAPFDLTQAVQDQMALSLVDDEASDLLGTVYDAVTPTNWVNGNTGGAISSDDVASMTLTRTGLFAAKRLIQQQGHDVRPGNLVLFIHPKAYQELMLQTDLNNYYQWASPDITARGVLEMIYGVELVVTDHVKAQDNTTNDTYRNVMTVKGIALGLASARDITFEAQRRNELQQILITANQRVKGAVIDETATARISTAQ